MTSSVVRRAACASKALVVALAFVVVGDVVACRRRRVVDEPPRAQPDVTSSIAPDAASSLATHVEASAPIAIPSASAPRVFVAPVPPSVACTPDPRVRFAQVHDDDDRLSLDSGPAGFACSPLKVNDAPLTLSIAPGTILRMPVDVEVADGDGGFEAPQDPPTFVSAGLPKRAWVDPSDRALKWHVAGHEGEAFAFTVGARVSLADGVRCATMSVVARVVDDARTRRAQAQWIRREEAVGHAEHARFMFSLGSPGHLEFLRQVRCGDVPVEPQMIDADGDHLDDAIFVYDHEEAGRANPDDVLLRRGETFAFVGSATGGLHRTADGTTFFFDDAAAGTGMPCAIGYRIAQVFPNRVEVVVDESTFNPGTAPGSLGCVGIDETDGVLVGFHETVSTETAVLSKRTWRWSGKRFQLVP